MTFPFVSCGRFKALPITISVCFFATLLAFLFYLPASTGAASSVDIGFNPALNSGISTYNSINSEVFENNNESSKLDRRGGITAEESALLNESQNVSNPLSCQTNQTVTSTDNSGTGSLRDAVTNACDNGTISFAPSLAGETITLTSGQLIINISLEISNTQAPGLIISGNNNSRIFDIRNNGNVTLSNLILENGNAGTEFGGAIRVLTDGQLTLLNSTIRDNQARAGGGIRNQGSTTIRFTTISNNSSPDEGGGGINNDVGGIMLIENSTISNNNSRWAGGIANYNGANLTVRSSTLSGNSCTGTVSGGGIENYSQSGFSGSSLFVAHSTITGNSCTGSNSSGGILNITLNPGLTHTIVAGNTGPRPDLSGSFNSNGHNLIGNTTGSNGITNGVNGDQAGSGASPIDPMLEELADNGGLTLTHALLPESPAIDAGENTGAPANDQRGAGFPRILNGNIDIGAYETCFNNLTVTNTNDNGFGSIRERIVSTCSGGTVNFSSSLAEQTITLTTGQIVLDKNITIANTEADGLSISGNDNTRVFNISGTGNVTLSNLIITNGNASGALGGGIRVLNGGQLLLLNSTVQNNQALAGGGLRSEGSGSMVTIRNSTFTGNATPNEGGGAINNDSGSQMRIENSSIINNSARWGGGVANYNGSNLVVVNSTFSENSCTGSLSGGAIENYNQSTFPVSSLTVRHSTITNNSCTGTNSSGGIFNSSQAPLIGHTIVAGNTGPRPDVSGVFNNDGFNLIGISTGSNSFVNGSNGNQVGSEASPIDPMLAGLASNGGPTLTHALLPGSTAIDAGSPFANPGALPSDELGNPVDQRGFPRFQGAGIDIGSVEADALSIALTGSQGFRLLTSPVVTTISDLLEGIWTQGMEGANTEAGNPNVWRLDKTSTGSDSSVWVPVTSLDQTIESGEGFLVYVFEDDVYNEPSENPWPKILTVEGDITALPVSPDINQNPNGFTLLGNPTVSSIAWDDVVRNHINDAVYVWDPNRGAAGAYISWSLGVGDLKNGVIRPFQGFIVQSSAGAGTPSLEINKTTLPGEFYGRPADADDWWLSEVTGNEPPSVRFSLQGEGLESSAWLRFSDRGTTELDPGDALKLQPLSTDYAILATLSENRELLDINHLPSELESTLHIPVAAETTRPGSYMLHVTGLRFPAGAEWTAVLKDHKTGAEMPLIEGLEYTFEIESDQARVTPNEPGRKAAESNPLPVLAENEQEYRFSLQIIPAGSEIIDLPEIIALDQNYPNPFNPVTTIRFQLPESNRVLLEVYDITGRRVATLVNGQVDAGFHQIRFDGTRLSSGVYIYRMQTGSEVFTRKMMLIK